MSDAHGRLAELAPAYVLGALDSEERRLFDEHLATCPACVAEMHSFFRITSTLAADIQGVPPPARVRERVLAEVRSAAGVGPAERAAGRPTLRWVLAAGLPVAASLLMVAGLGVYAAGLRARVADLEARLDRATTQMLAGDRAIAEARRVALDTQSAMAVLAAPDLARIDLAGEATAPQASARALWSRQRGMVFTATELPPLPAGRVYQVWVVTGEAPISAGLLEPDPSGRGVGIFSTPADIGAPVAVAVTLEPEGGVPAPTGPRYLIGTPSPRI
jgi:anti-sigma-K factor RskA